MEISIEEARKFVQLRRPVYLKDQQALGLIGAEAEVQFEKGKEYFARDVVLRHTNEAIEFRDKFLPEVRQNFGVICFSESWDDLLMWAHYTQSHAGFVVGFDTRHPYFKKLLKIDYLNQRAKLGDLAQSGDEETAKRRIKALFSIKSDHWGYEREWRLVNELSKCVRSLDPNKKKFIYHTALPPETITEVHFGCRCETDLEERIRANKHFAHTKFRRLKLHDSLFALVNADS